MARPKKSTIDVATEVRLLRAAEEVFGSRGYASGRLEDIAEGAGVRRSSLLYHYGTKEALYKEVVAHGYSQLRDVVAQALGKGESFRERLRAVVQALIDFEASKPQISGLVLRDLINKQSPAHEMVHHELKPIIDLLEQFIRANTSDTLPESFPVRQTVLQLYAGHMVRTASGELGLELWGDIDHTVEITMKVFSVED
ncbi:MAG: hypothetical protein CMH54_13840 [Myxococcales bacterium]|nr:hypothetical protein [Myxococcales bacterium]